MRSEPVSFDLFCRNRSRLLKLLPDRAVAVVCSNPFMPRNGDQFYPYRQHSDFFYLTGISQQGSVFVISSKGEVLFVRKPDPKTLLWSGPLLSREEAAKLSGIREVRWLDELDFFLNELLGRTDKLFLNHRESGGPGSELRMPDEQMFEKVGRQFPNVERNSLASLMTQLRMLKEPEELVEIRKAAAITRSAFFRVLKSLKPGVMEFEVEAEISAEFIRNGAMGHAFEPIVASGSNALVLHHVENSGTCIDGELLLMDFGAEVNHYAADCSRTLPVAGKFTKRQRELYDSVHKVFMKARDLMVPGTIMGDFHKQVGKLWEEEHIALGLYTMKDVRERGESDPPWRDYYMHGTSHSLGLDVHDPFDRSVPFTAGMVLTCEPGIYISGEGVGIRLENDILISDKGPVDLLEDIPIEADEIEELMYSMRIRR